jgi:hypothetical protein
MYSRLHDRFFCGAEMKAQLSTAELKNKRLMEAFKKTSQELREVSYQLLGYRIDIPKAGHYRLMNMYAETQNDFFIFMVILYALEFVDISCCMKGVSAILKVKFNNELISRHLLLQHHYYLECEINSNGSMN